MSTGNLTLQCGDLILADGTTTGGLIEEVTLNGQRLIHERELCRSDWIVLFDRGNKRNQFELRWLLQCATLTAAADAAMGFGDDLPNLGDFKLGLTSGGLTWQGVMSDAGWKNPRTDFNKGVAVLFSCTVVGGQLVRTGAGFGGDGEAGTFYASIRSLATGFESIAISATGNDTITPDTSPSVVGVHSVQATVTAPGGAYTHKIILATAGRLTGNLIAVRCVMPQSASPSIEFRNATSGGTTLETLAGDAVKARTYLLTFVFNGSAWLLQSSEESLS